MSRRSLLPNSVCTGAWERVVSERSVRKHHAALFKHSLRGVVAWSLCDQCVSWELNNEPTRASIILIIITASIGLFGDVNVRCDWITKPQTAHLKRKPRVLRSRLSKKQGDPNRDKASYYLLSSCCVVRAIPVCFYCLDSVQPRVMMVTMMMMMMAARIPLFCALIAGGATRNNK